MKIKDSLDTVVDLFLVLIATTSDPSTFKELHECRLVLEQVRGISDVSD